MCAICCYQVICYCRDMNHLAAFSNKFRRSSIEKRLRSGMRIEQQGREVARTLPVEPLDKSAPRVVRDGQPVGTHVAHHCQKLVLPAADQVLGMREYCETRPRILSHTLNMAHCTCQMNYVRQTSKTTCCARSWSYKYVLACDEKPHYRVILCPARK